MRQLNLMMLSLLVVAGCTRADVSKASMSGPVDARPDVAPADFVLLPCSGHYDGPCVLVMAGGKRLLFGAPAGISGQLLAEDFSNLDAAFLFSLHPGDVEGLDEVRNHGWRAGRLETLAVTGPDGTAALVDGLNLAYEQPDALTFVEDGAPAGGFDAALLTSAQDLIEDALVFDSGDLKVRAGNHGTGRLTFRVGYRDIGETWHEVVLSPCGGGAVAEGGYDIHPRDRVSVACDNPDAEYSWPLLEPIFVEKSQR